MKEVSIKYIVKHGHKNPSKRRVSRFSDEWVALQYFREKEKENVYVDVYKETTTILLEKMTK